MSSKRLNSGTPRMAVLLPLVAILLGLFSSQAFAGLPHKVPHRPKHDTHHEIEGLEEQWRQAVLTNNVSTMDRLLAEDYTAITANGTVQTKAQVLAAHKEGRYQILSLDVSDRKIRLYGNTAVVTSRADVSLKDDNKEMNGKFRYTRVYIRNSSGQWKIVNFEFNKIRDPNDREAH